MLFIIFIILSFSFIYFFFHIILFHFYYMLIFHYFIIISLFIISFEYFSRSYYHAPLFITQQVFQIVHRRLLWGRPMTGRMCQLENMIDATDIQLSFCKRCAQRVPAQACKWWRKKRCRAVQSRACSERAAVRARWACARRAVPPCPARKRRAQLFFFFRLTDAVDDVRCWLSYAQTSITRDWCIFFLLLF